MTPPRNSPRDHGAQISRFGMQSRNLAKLPRTIINTILVRVLTMTTFSSMMVITPSPLPLYPTPLSLTPQRALELAERREVLHRGGDINGGKFSWLPDTHRLLYSAVSESDGKSWIYSLDVETGVLS